MPYRALQGFTGFVTTWNDKSVMKESDGPMAFALRLVTPSRQDQVDAAGAESLTRNASRSTSYYI